MPNKTKKAKSAFSNHVIITKSDDPRAKWYVVHTYSGHELKVCSKLQQRVETMNLADRILEVLIPTQQAFRIQHGKKQEVTEKLFPGYILVRIVLDDASWLAVRTTQGVTGFIGIGSKPTPISEKEVEAIQKYMALDAPKIKAKFSISEAVRIVDGPFAEFIGSVEEIDEEKGKVRVMVSIFGRETPVELDFLQVSKL